MVEAIPDLGLMPKRRVDRTLEIRRLRKMLAQDGADPFLVAATALETVGRYAKTIEQLRSQLGSQQSQPEEDPVSASFPVPVAGP